MSESRQRTWRRRPRASSPTGPASCSPLLTARTPPEQVRPRGQRGTLWHNPGHARPALCSHNAQWPHIFARPGRHGRGLRQPGQSGDPRVSPSISHDLTARFERLSHAGPRQRRNSRRRSRDKYRRKQPDAAPV